MCLLPERDKMGRSVLLFRIKDIKLEGKCLMKDFMTAIAILTDSLAEIEEFIIRGTVYIIDVSGLTPAHLLFVPIENFIKCAKNGERCVVGRHKGFHVVGLPPALSFLMNLGLHHAEQKIRERMKFYSSFDQVSVVDKKNLPLVISINFE